MAQSTVSREDWDVLTRFLPDGWQAQARQTGALRRARSIPDADTLLRCLLIHLAQGCSLRETAARASASGLATISDVALWKRLRGSQEWFRWLSEGLLNRMEPSRRDRDWSGGYRVELVDASVICEPGSTGADWRLHYGILLDSLQCEHFELTDTTGGETYRRFAFSPGDLVMGDRGYAQPRGIRHVDDCGAASITRLNATAVPLQTPKGRPFSQLPKLRKLRIGGIGEWDAALAGATDREAGIPVRVCAIKKSREATEQARKKIRRVASKKGKTTRPGTLEVAAYIVVLTTAPADRLTADRVLELYRARWQVELAFKRMKSIIGLGHLPKIDPDSARAWLHGKLFVALLTEAIVHESEYFSPWGYPLA